MTLPDERYRSVLQTKQFLCDLLDPKKTPRIPKDIRRRASGCLRHYPDKFHMDLVASIAGQVFETKDTVDPLTKMIYCYDIDKQRA